MSTPTVGTAIGTSPPPRLKCMDSSSPSAAFGGCTLSTGPTGCGPPPPEETLAFLRKSTAPCAKVQALPRAQCPFWKCQQSCVLAFAGMPAAGAFSEDGASPWMKLHFSPRWQEPRAAQCLQGTVRQFTGRFSCASTSSLLSSSAPARAPPASHPRCGGRARWGPPPEARPCALGGTKTPCPRSFCSSPSRSTRPTGRGPRTESSSGSTWSNMQLSPREQKPAAKCMQGSSCSAAVVHQSRSISPAGSSSSGASSSSSTSSSSSSPP
mmetsp:Transcript_110958/g.324574  ORF Transcript_110958/g.324574 Transcript_110958/m.324574 type:complete len:267 (+) Transcript_110958:82-882(+)